MRLIQKTNVAGGLSSYFLWAMCLLLAALTGFGYAAYRAEIRMQDALSPELQGVDIDVQGAINSLPQFREHGAVSFDFYIKMPPPGLPHNIHLSWYNARPEQIANIHAGMVWNFTVRLKRPHASQNPYSFDFEGWLLQQNIRAEGYVHDTKSAPGNNFPLSSPREKTVDVLREAVRDNIYENLSNDTHPYRGMLVALSVGEQSSIPPEQWSIFVRTGVTHLMSISGLHVTMMSALIYGLVFWLYRRRPISSYPAQKVAAVAGLLAALLYTLLAGFGVPAQRTLYMLAAITLSVVWGRQLTAFQMLSFALLVVLLVDPWAVLSVGFWLSFAAVAMLMYVSSGSLSKRSWDVVRGQMAVTLGSIPLLLLLFQQFSLISPLANLVAIPTVSFIISPLSILGGILSWHWLLSLTHEATSFLMSFLEILAAWPAAVWQQAAPPLWAWVLAILGVMGVLLPPRVPGKAVAFFAFLPMLLYSPPRPHEGEMRLAVLDVGQGSAAHIQTAHHDIMVDAGPDFRGSSDSGERIVYPYLRAMGVKRLDALVLSHADADHIGGGMSLLRLMPTDLGYGAAPKNNSDDPNDEKVVLPNWTPCLLGQKWQWDGVEFEFLHPNLQTLASHTAKKNETSCVLKVTSAYGAVLLPGDIPSSIEEMLVRTVPEKLWSEVLVAAHHGSKSSSSENFVEAVTPQYALFSVGYRSQYGHPDPQVLDRLSFAEIWRTDIQGAILADFTPQGIRLSAQRKQYQRYWLDRPEEQ